VRALLAFVRLSRPLFLYGGVAGVALGAAVAAFAGRRLDLATYGWAQLLVTAFQLMVHYANDYYDRDGDLASVRTPWSGGSGVIASGALPRSAAWNAAVACAAIGGAASSHFALAGNGIVAALGGAIFILAWAYSAPPVRLAGRGLGEADTALIVGVLVPAVGYAAFARTVDDRLLTAALPCFVALLAMMLCVELPDAGTDRVAGKRTLVVRWGPSRTWGIAAGLAGAAAVIALALAGRTAHAPGALLLLPACVAAAGVALAALRDPRPATLAFRGVALYASTVTGLAAAYVLGSAV
jgi:1,4-dihydroxy-2-naphthoate polyprenyltransferase